MNVIRKMSFQQRVIGLTLFSLTLIIPAALFSGIKLYSLDKAVVNLEVGREQVQHINRLKLFLADFERGQRSYMLIGDPAYLEPYSLAEGQFNEVVGKLTESNEDTKFKEVLTQVIQLKDAWIKNSSIPQMMARKKMERGMISSQDFISYISSFNDKKTFSEIYNSLSYLEKHVIDSYSKLVEQSRAEAKETFWVTVATIVMFLMCFASITTYSIMVSRKVKNSIAMLTQVVSDLQKMNLGIADVTKGLDQVIENQAQSVQTTASVSEDLKSTAQSNFNILEGSSEVTNRGVRLSKSGYEVAHSLLSVVSEIRENFETQMAKVLEAINRVGEFSRQIEEIKLKTRLINDIVFQTKLLSFNASVEAVRAGEHGKGFSVVAEEVGRLSSISGTTSKEIEDTLNVAIQKAESIIVTAKASVTDLKLSVDSGISKIVENAQNNESAFKEISSCSEAVLERFSQIKNAISGQLSGIETISSQIHDLGEVSGVTRQKATASKAVASDLNETIGVAEKITSSLCQIFEGQTEVSKDLKDFTPTFYEEDKKAA